MQNIFKYVVVRIVLRLCDLLDVPLCGLDAISKKHVHCPSDCVNN